ncbi:hypothetical protein DRO61_07920 [Candidatus Bathyarchaeota archaeon]|jgi:hypothetical protein|nr:MAG: hypothetical protein DRO61_07920 [Candidatus Bathyarchaeota archaeon]
MASINGYEIVLLVTSIATALTIYLTTRKRRIEKKSEKVLDTETIEREALSLLPVKNEKNIKILNLEKEIQNFVETRLLEAETKGKISHVDRMRLVKKYNLEIQHLDQKVSNRAIIFQKQEYEPTQELENIFQKKFNEINDTVNNIKNHLENLPKEEIKESVKLPMDVLHVQQKGQTIKKKATDKKKKRQKSKSEKRIENIQDEVLKIIAQIEQIEMEG